MRAQVAIAERLSSLYHKQCTQAQLVWRNPKRRKNAIAQMINLGPGGGGSQSSSSLLLQEERTAPARFTAAGESREVAGQGPAALPAPCEPRPGLCTTCVNCENEYAEDAAYCRKCGEIRLPHKHIDEAFRLYAGNRTLLRKTDLVHLTLHARRLQQSLSVVCHKTFRRLGTEIREVFDEVIETQRDNGLPFTQGLTPDGFQIFLTRVARLLCITGHRLLLGLFVEAGVRTGLEGLLNKERGAAVEEGDMAHKTATGTGTGGSSVTPYGKCGGCGNKLLAEDQFCRKCGHARAPETHAEQLGAFLRSGLIHSSDEIVTLSRKYNAPVDDVRTKSDLFRKCDADGDSVLSLREFSAALRQHLKMPQEAPLSPQLVNKSWKAADRDGNGEVDFEEFLAWALSTSGQPDANRLVTKEIESTAGGRRSALVPRKAV